MGKQSAEKIAQRAFDLGLLDERQLRDAWAHFASRDVSADDFLQVMVRREYMTNYQVELLVKGERSGFFFGEYKVLYLVGAGSFARVYRAVHRRTGQVVAVKVLRSRFSDNPSVFDQFVREGRVGCSLQHPNIVPTYEVFSDGKTHFLVMEFIEGRNLSEFVKIRKKIGPVEATRLMSGIVAGMRHAFEKGLSHRDLKMNNVLVSSRGEAKLVDFGLAAMDESVNDDLGDLPNARTIDYAALERASGVRKDDARSDIYFLGCIYYNMLTGRPPLKPTRDRVQRLSKTRFLEVVPIRKADSAIPHPVAIAVSKAMMLDPERRYQSPVNMLRDLKIVARKLAEDPSLVQNGLDSQGRPTQGAVAKTYTPPEDQPSVMIVESNPQMQDIFRKGFKQAGYRVLITSDPSRALSRFQQDSTAADSVVLNAQQLGSAAVEAFNALGKDVKTNMVPTVLLLDEEQRKWKSKAKTAGHRVVLPMPITMKKLRAVLAKLVAPQERVTEPSGKE